MKKVLIFIVIYILVAIIVSAINAIPSKINQEEMDAYTEAVAEKMREDAEKRWPNMPEEIREAAAQDSANTVRSLYEYENTFSYKFMKELTAFGIAFVPIIVGMVLIWLYWKIRPKRI